MYHHKIPVENIRAHYHWPREGYNPPNKDCPHFLLENGRPGETWRWFVGRINQHYVRLVQNSTKPLASRNMKEDAAKRRKQMVQAFWNKVTDFIGTELRVSAFRGAASPPGRAPVAFPLSPG